MPAFRTSAAGTVLHVEDEGGTGAESLFRARRQRVRAGAVGDLRGAEEHRPLRLMTGETPVWDPLFHRNFGRLVLFCIDTSDDESWRIFQHFSRSTRSAFLCTASNPGNFAKSRQNFLDFFVIFLQNLYLFCSNSSFFVPIFMKISQDFTKFSEIFGNS